MPTYQFHNTDTNEYEETFMSISEMELYLKLNSNIKKVLSTPNFISSQKSAMNNKDGGWNELQSRIAKANPTSTLADKVGGRSTKEVKLNNFAKKWKARGGLQ
jgi:hypothetical protein